MATFIALVLVVLALQGLFVAAKYLGPHDRPLTITPFRYNFFRGDGLMGSSNHIDRDAERAFAEMVAMTHHAPHN